jgi:hypothetical protein
LTGAQAAMALLASSASARPIKRLAMAPTGQCSLS